MLSVFRPSEGAIVDFLNTARRAKYAYDEVGATRVAPPCGYNFDQQRVCLGRGAEVFQQARLAIRQWRMFPPAMAEILWPQTAIQPEAVVGVLLKAAGAWSLNACRIVYVVDEADERSSRYGFAYGTLAGHVERGEELFQVEHRYDDDTVWYEIACFSRPNHWLSRLGYPFVRREQRRFRELSAEAMRSAVATANCSELAAT